MFKRALIKKSNIKESGTEIRKNGEWMAWRMYWQGVDIYLPFRLFLTMTQCVSGNIVGVFIKNYVRLQKKTKYGRFFRYSEIHITIFGGICCLLLHHEAVYRKWITETPAEYKAGKFQTNYANTLAGLRKNNFVFRTYHTIKLNNAPV